MLASRGFVYRSAQAAAAGWHRGCDCSIVPDFDGGTTVEGYDPDGMRSRWNMCADSVQLDPDSGDDAVLEAIMRECDTRDPRWLWSGELPDVVYGKARSKLADHELAGVDALRANGFALETIDEIDDAPANFDLVMNGRLYEMKNVTNAGSSVSNQIKRARVKWYKLGIEEPARIVFTMEDSTASALDVADGIRRRKRNREDILLVVSENQVIRI